MSERQERRVVGFHEGSFVASAHTVTSVRIENVFGHDRVVVFNRGGCAGAINVQLGDGQVIAERLIPNGEWVTE